MHPSIACRALLRVFLQLCLLPSSFLVISTYCSSADTKSTLCFDLTFQFNESMSSLAHNTGYYILPIHLASSNQKVDSRCEFSEVLREVSAKPGFYSRLDSSIPKENTDMAPKGKLFNAGKKGSLKKKV